VRVKLDENLGNSVAKLLRRAGHDATTVREQNLAGATDENIFGVCKSEGRVLITLDRDFGQVQRFQPRQSAGIVILELGGPASLRLIQERVRDFLALAATRSVVGELWIVEAGRVRVHLEKNDE
jgi:predicted nuclease of predicted toxin-antitoxin system